MGSEMCIRDSARTALLAPTPLPWVQLYQEHVQTVWLASTPQHLLPQLLSPVRTVQWGATQQLEPQHALPVVPAGTQLLLVCHHSTTV